MKDEKTETIRQEAVKAAAVDTTAAGDTFTGYFVAGLTQGKQLGRCMEEAGKAATISVTRPGVADSIPGRNELESLITG